MKQSPKNRRYYKLVRMGVILKNLRKVKKNNNDNVKIEKYL